MISVVLRVAAAAAALLLPYCALAQKLPSEARGSSIAQIVMLSVDGAGCAGGVVVGYDMSLCMSRPRSISSGPKTPEVRVDVRFNGIREPWTGRFLPQTKGEDEKDLAVVKVGLDPAVRKFLDGLDFAMLSPARSEETNTPATSIGCSWRSFWTLGTDESILKVEGENFLRPLECRPRTIRWRTLQ